MFTDFFYSFDKGFVQEFFWEIQGGVDEGLLKDFDTGFVHDC